MSHVRFLHYTTPKGHQELVQEINKWKYPVEGPVRRGTIAPYISEIKLYDVRIPEELVSQFIRDMRMQTGLGGTQAQLQGSGILGWGLRIFRWVTRSKSFDNPRDKAFMFELPGWSNSFLVHVAEDPKKLDVNTGKMREVL